MPAAIPTCSPSRGVALAALIVASLGSTPVLADWVEIPPEAWHEPARPDSGGGDAIVLLDRSEYRQDSDKFRVEHFTRARVFTPEGRDIGNVEVRYRKEWKLSDLRGRSVAPGGRVVELDPAQILRSTVLSVGEFEIEQAAATIPGIEPGSIVEWSYVLEGESGMFGSWRFEFSDRYYTCVSTHTWRPTRSTANLMKKTWQYAGIQSAFVQETCEPSCATPETVTFTTRCLAGVRDEELAPPAEDATPRVFVYYMKASTTPAGHWTWWKSGVDQYQKLFGEHRDVLDEAVAEIRRHYAQPDSALIAAFYWVRDRFRSMGELSGDEWPDRRRIWKSYRMAPHANRLMEKRDASPLEINTMMAMVARQLGYPAYVGMVGDRRVESFDHRVLGLPPFNFVTVVMMGTRRVFLHPDSRFATFGSVPWYYRGGYCLVSGDGPELMMTVPVDGGARATAWWGLEVTLGEDGQLDGRITGRLGGEEACRWRRALWNEPEAGRADLLRRRFGGGGGPKVEVNAPAPNAPPETPFELSMTAHWPAITGETGGRIVVSPAGLAPWRTHPRLEPAWRKQPLLFRDLLTEVFNIFVRIPAGYTVERLPDPQMFRNRVGGFSVSWSRDGDAALMERRLDLDHAQIGPQDYSAARELFQRLDAADRSVLLLTRVP